MDTCCNTDTVAHKPTAQIFWKFWKTSRRCYSDRTRKYAYFLSEASLKYPFKYNEISVNVTFLGLNSILIIFHNSQALLTSSKNFLLQPNSLFGFLSCLLSRHLSTSHISGELWFQGTQEEKTNLESHLSISLELRHYGFHSSPTPQNTKFPSSEPCE